MANTAWLKTGKIVMSAGHVVLCGSCPCANNIDYAVYDIACLNSRSAAHLVLNTTYSLALPAPGSGFLSLWLFCDVAIGTIVTLHWLTRTGSGTTALSLWQDCSSPFPGIPTITAPGDLSCPAPTLTYIMMEVDWNAADTITFNFTQP